MFNTGVKLKLPDMCPFDSKPCNRQKYRRCVEKGTNDRTKCMKDPELFAMRKRVKSMDKETLGLIAASYQINGVPADKIKWCTAIADEIMARTANRKTAKNIWEGMGVCQI